MNSGFTCAYYREGGLMRNEVLTVLFVDVPLPFDFFVALDDFLFLLFFE